MGVDQTWQVYKQMLACNHRESAAKIKMKLINGDNKHFYLGLCTAYDVISKIVVA